MKGKISIMFLLCIAVMAFAFAQTAAAEEGFIAPNPPSIQESGDGDPAADSMQETDLHTGYLPSGLQIVEESAFEGTAFVNIRFSEETEDVSIGKNAFANNENLIAIYLPDTVTHIDDDALKNSGGILFTSSSSSYAWAWAHTHDIRSALDEAIRQKKAEAFFVFFREPAVQQVEVKHESVGSNLTAYEKTIRPGRSVAELKASHFKGIAAQHIQSRFFP